MRRILLGLLVAALLLSAALLGGCRVADNPEGSPNAPTSGGLVDSPKEWDGRTVSFIGEAVGEAMSRGEMSWIHLNDDAYYIKNVEEGAHLGGYNSGMAVWIDTTLAEKVRVFGDYKHEGDVVKVTGVFNAACGEHGGDMDIHATSLEPVTDGREANDPVKPEKLVWAIGLALFAGVLYLADRAGGTWRDREKA